MAKETKDHHCSGCGHDTKNSEEPLAKVQLGRWTTNGANRRVWKPSETWGIMHQRCFLMAIGDPQGVTMMAQATG